jgi:hypothetical protein
MLKVRAGRRRQGRVGGRRVVRGVCACASRAGRPRGRSRGPCAPTRRANACARVLRRSRLTRPPHPAGPPPPPPAPLASLLCAHSRWASGTC